MNGRFNPSIDKIRASFSNIRALFSIFKKGQGRPPPFPPSFAPAIYSKQVVLLDRIEHEYFSIALTLLFMLVFLISNPHKCHAWFKKYRTVSVPKLHTMFMTCNSRVIITWNVNVDQTWNFILKRHGNFTEKMDPSTRMRTFNDSKHCHNTWLKFGDFFSFLWPN